MDVARADAGPGAAAASRARVTVCRLVPSAWATAETLSPALRRRRASARCSGARLWGRPMGLPSARARRRPAWVRSTRRSRSNSATALMTPMVSLPVDDVRIHPAERQAVDAHAQARQRPHRGRHVHGVASQPVELGHHQHVAFLEPVHQLCEAPPLHGSHRARHGLGYDAARVDGEARSPDLAELVVGGLLGGADPEVGEGARHGGRGSGLGTGRAPICPEPLAATFTPFTTPSSYLLGRGPAGCPQPVLFGRSGPTAGLSFAPDVRTAQIPDGRGRSVSR